ncbi:MAG: Citrate lyase subunit beta-like protein [Acidimicrobiales bacterium]|nr:Citrate lyase subunit beta-like protein [Acidimicrobiales bacterium]
MRWRSVLFVPGNRPDLAVKALRSAPDVVVLDLEDAVPTAGKVEARDTVRDAAVTLAGATVLVRVNPPGTEWFEGDVAALPAGLAGVVVPKFEAPVDVGLPVVAGLETVRGVTDARSILEGVTACYFGAEDYVADLGGVRTPGNAEVGTARALVGMAARLAGVPALDMVTLDFGDTDRFVTEAAEARALGYAGKLCIHPAQVGPANDAFVPSAEELERAERLLAAFDAGGGATVAFEGQMVDEVVARQARALLERKV